VFQRAKQTATVGSRVTVLDLGTSKFTCLIGEWVQEPHDEGAPLGALLRVVGIGHQRARGMKAGVLVDLDAAELAVRDVVAQAEKQAGEQVEQGNKQRHRGHDVIGLTAAHDLLGLEQDQTGHQQDEHAGNRQSERW